MDTNKYYKLLGIAFGMLIIFGGCKPPKYEQTKAYVYKVAPYHWGRGFYKQKVYYQFVYKNDTIMSNFVHPQLYFFAPTEETIARMGVQVGDSLRIQFPQERPKKSKVLKLIKKR